MLTSLMLAAWEGLVSSANSLGDIAIIVIPLMLGLEIAKDTGLMAKISRWFHPVAKPLAVSNAAVFPLLIGLVFGLSYGSGVIINAAKSGELSRTDRYGVAIFLSVSHSLIEDTLLLVAVGANALWLVSLRVLLPVIITALATRTILANGPKLPRLRSQSS